MPLEFSKTQLRKLGERLARPDGASEEDLQLLESVYDAYGEALVAAVDTLAACFPKLAIGSRVKTRPTLIDKLRRTPEIKLPSIRDIAGARIVLPEGGLREQRAVVARVIETFSGDGRPPKLIDRLASPSHGYRALHVEVESLGLPVEIQVRTFPQHRWAELTEKLGDLWGRGIRYGEPPEESDRLVVGNTTRAEVWSTVTQLGEVIAEAEVLDEGLAQIEDQHLVEAQRTRLRESQVALRAINIRAVRVMGEWLGTLA
jgi:ppGpp synthetase/RelA/SpoT-type nucleotidyltranferase